MKHEQPTERVTRERFDAVLFDLVGVLILNYEM